MRRLLLIAALLWALPVEAQQKIDIRDTMGRAILVDDSGFLPVDLPTLVDGKMPVVDSEALGFLEDIKERLPTLEGGNQPVTVKASVLPAGAAKDTTLTSIREKMGDGSHLVEARNTDWLGNGIDSRGSALAVVQEDGSGALVAVATAGKQNDIATSTDNIDGKLPALVTEHSENRVPVSQTAHVCTSNSTTTPLGAGEPFVGEWQPMLSYGSIYVTVFTDQDSAALGALIEYSHDEATVINDDVYTFFAAAGSETWKSSPTAQYFRVRYVNGATPQGYLVITTILRAGHIASSHRVLSPITGEDDAGLTLAVLAAQLPGGGFTIIDATTGGNLKLSIEEVNGTADVATKTIQTDGTQVARAMYIDKDGAQVQGLANGGGSGVSIARAHWIVHAQEMWRARGTCGVLGAADVKRFRLTTPAGTEIHMQWEVEVNSQVTVLLLENPTLNVAGTQRDIYNQDRNAADITGGASYFWENDTLTAPGLELDSKTVGGWSAGGGPVPASGSSGTARSGELEWILRPSEDYEVTITALAADTECSFAFLFYDENAL